MYSRKLLEQLRKVFLLPFILPFFIYQKVISPFTPDSCIYYPSCSEYGKTALLQHGLLKGIVLALFRLLRCSGGLFTGGYDPVPKQFTKKRLFGAYREFWRGRW